MVPDNSEPGLFNGHVPDFDWEPSDAEIAAALELNTLTTFRTQFRRLRTRYSSFVKMHRLTESDLVVFSDWADVNKQRYLDGACGLTMGTELEQVPGDVKIITYFDSRYPPQLRDIYDPPPVLYVMGDISFDYSTSLAIVGTRTKTEYGRRTTEHFAYQLASWGFTVISGGARGIDSIAHYSALDADGKTIAVLGCGIDVTFPPENKRLFRDIAETGAIISEFPMGLYPGKYNFPARNRIIAALGRGTLVIEAPERSGALITAELALQNGKDVFAVPGRLTDGRSRGTNKLIHDGACMVLDPSDIPLRFGLTVVEGDDAVPVDLAAHLDGDEALVYKAVTLDAREADVIVREVGLPAPRILSALLILQTKGLVKELPGSRFVRPVRPKLP